MCTQQINDFRFKEEPAESESSDDEDEAVMQEECSTTVEYGEASSSTSLQPYIKELNQQLSLVRQKLCTAEDDLKQMDDTVEEIKKISRTQEEIRRREEHDRVMARNQCTPQGVFSPSSLTPSFISPHTSKVEKTPGEPSAGLDTETRSALLCFLNLKTTRPLSRQELKKFLDCIKHTKNRERFDHIVRKFTRKDEELKQQLVSFREMLSKKKNEFYRITEFDSQPLLNRLDKIISKLSREIKRP